MAINIFKNVTANLVTGGAVLYTAPTGYTAIVLSAQLSNITNNPVETSMFLLAVGGSPATSLITNFSVPAYDAAAATTGKLVIQSGQSILASAVSNSSIQLVLSILETQN